MIIDLAATDFAQAITHDLCDQSCVRFTICPRFQHFSVEASRLVNLSQPQTNCNKRCLMDLCSIVCPLWHCKSLPKSDLGKRSNSCQIQNGGNSLWNAWIIIIFQLLAIFWDSNGMWILIRIDVRYTTCIYCEICPCSAIIAWLRQQIWPTLR